MPLYNPTLPALVCAPPVLPPLSFSQFGGGQFSLIPGAGSLSSIYRRGLREYAASLAFLAPFKPALGIIGALVKIVRGLVSVPPDAVMIAEGVATLAVEATNLAQLVIFPVQLVRTVRGGVQLLLGYLQSTKADVAQLITRYTDVNALIAEAQASGNAALLATAICAKERLDGDLARMNAEMAGLGVLLALFSTALCIVSGGHLGALPALDGGALTAAAFDPPIAALSAILIAVPDLPGVGLSC